MSDIIPEYDISGKKIGIMVCGHGSRDNAAVEQFKQVSQQLKQKWQHLPVEYGFLEFATPIIRNGLDSLIKQGCEKILAIPGMLFAAGHAKNDIPSVLNTYQASHPDVEIIYGRELGVDLRMLKAAGDRITTAVDGLDDNIKKTDTMLVVVGRGSSDPDANSNVSKMTRMLWEGLGFGWAETCYSGVTFPLVEPGLEHFTRLGYKRIIIFPYFLFTGILVNRIYQSVDVVAARHPDIEFIKAPYLNDHPLVMDVFASRALEILNGGNVMNCQMCKFREQLLGFEAEVGMAQESHHHHVEGINDNSDGYS